MATRSTPIDFNTMETSSDHLLLVDEQKMVDIEKPHHHDVLCGRGVTTNRHPGNESFRSLVSLNKEVYVSSTKRQKMSISRSIVEAVRSLDPPGRFLEKDQISGLWSDIGHKKAVEKTSQALRDGAATLRKQLSADLGDPEFLNAVFDMETDNDGSETQEKEDQKMKGDEKDGGSEKASLSEPKEKDKVKKAWEKNKQTKQSKVAVVKKTHRRVKSNPSSNASAMKQHLRRVKHGDAPASPLARFAEKYPHAPPTPSSPLPRHAASQPNSPMTWGGRVPLTEGQSPGGPVPPYDYQYSPHHALPHHSPHHFSPPGHPSSRPGYPHSYSYDYHHYPPTDPWSRDYSYHNSWHGPPPYHHPYHADGHGTPPPAHPGAENHHRRERSPTREAYPHGRREYSPRRREYSPRPREYSPGRRDHSPRPRDRSPRPSEHSPRRQEHQHRPDSRSPSPSHPPSPLPSGALPPGRHQFSPAGYHSKPHAPPEWSPRYVQQHQSPRWHYSPRHGDYGSQSPHWRPHSPRPEAFAPPPPSSSQSSLDVPRLGGERRLSKSPRRVMLIPRSRTSDGETPPRYPRDSQRDFVPPQVPRPYYGTSHRRAPSPSSPGDNASPVEEKKSVAGEDRKRNNSEIFPVVTEPSSPSTVIKLEQRETPGSPSKRENIEPEDPRSSPGIFLRENSSENRSSRGGVYLYHGTDADAKPVDDIAMSPLPFDQEDPSTLMELPDNLLSLPISPCGPHDGPQPDKLS